MQRLFLTKVIFGLFFLGLFFSYSAFASDVYIKIDDNEVGQGIMRQHGSECLIVTPAHVVEKALDIEITTTNRSKYSAEILELFPGDISILRLKSDDPALCRHASWFNTTHLNGLLEVEKEGELRTMLADGSIRVTPVDVIGYDKYRNINVRPKNKADAISKGESGSLLYIAGQLSGMLLFVKDDVGNVIRQDALTNTLALFFGDNQAGRQGTIPPLTRTKPAKPPAQEKTAVNEQEFSGAVIQNTMAEHRIKLEGNSPIRLNFSTTGGRGKYNVELLDSNRKVVYRDSFKRDSGTESVNIPFTAPKNDIYSLHIIGIEGEIKYTVKTAPIALDAQLRSETNVIQIGGNAVEGIIAKGAVAEYRVKLEENSPVRLTFPATGDQGKYSVEILDSTGKTVYRNPDKRYSEAETISLPFTAPKNDIYSLHIVGTEGEGKYSVKMKLIALSSQLRSEANVIQIDDDATIEGITAQGAVAEYRMTLEANSPIRLIFSPTGDQGKYNVEILDSTGKIVYRDPYKHYSGTEIVNIPFNASKSDTYALRITGTEGEVRYFLNIKRMS